MRELAAAIRLRLTATTLRPRIAGPFLWRSEVSEAADIRTTLLLERICTAGSLLALKAAAGHGADGAPIHARPVPVPGFTPFDLRCESSTDGAAYPGRR